MHKLALIIAALFAVVGLTACGESSIPISDNTTVILDSDGKVDSRQMEEACYGRGVAKVQHFDFDGDGNGATVTCR